MNYKVYKPMTNAAVTRNVGIRDRAVQETTEIRCFESQSRWPFATSGIDYGGLLSFSGKFSFKVFPQAVAVLSGPVTVLSFVCIFFSFVERVFVLCSSASLALHILNSSGLCPYCLARWLVLILVPIPLLVIISNARWLEIKTTNSTLS